MTTFLKKKTLLLVFLVAIITAGSLIMMRHAWNGVSLPETETRRVHNFNMLSKTLDTSTFGTSVSFQSQESEENVIASSSSQHERRNHASIPRRKSSRIDELTDIFKYKMSKVTLKEVKLEPVCHNRDVIANSCDDRCLQTKFPRKLRERIAQIVEPSKLQISPHIEEILDSMARKVRGDSEFMILSGTSSNHFLETQALIRNLHENIYPHFKNFTFVLYNLGLTSDERRKMVEFCKCQVVDFPFHKFPSFVSKKLCYAWKPVIVRAHIDQADIVMWIDASIRFDRDPSYFSHLLQRTKRRTMQVAFSRAISPFRTYRSMYHFFGDEPCMYLNMGQLQSGIDLFTNELFVKRVVLDPWAACAVTQSCSCPVEDPIKSCAKSKEVAEAWLNNKGPIVYGLCHRYDQSSLSIILHKLYQDTFRWVAFDSSRYIEIKRKDTHSYFDSLA